MSLVVVGDLLLDVDVEGTATRLCPDAPAPVLDVTGEHARPGGAGLAAALACSDGEPVVLVTAVAPDDAGHQLRDLLTMPHVLGPSSAPTPVKTRLRCAGSSIARLDRGGGGADPRVTDEMLDAVASADAVLVSDYGRGMTRDRRLREMLTWLARRVPVVWDPHSRGAEPTSGVRLATPNLFEASAFSGVDDVFLAASELRAKWRATGVAVTRGADGVVLDHGGTPVVVPAPRIPVLDPCGAGDRFAVTAAARLRDGAALDEAVSAGVTACADFLLRGAVLNGVDVARSKGHKVIATGGCFDVVHAGHIRTLRAARALGDFLVVCLNSDRSVRRLKGPGRPVNNQRDRAELLAALDCVDDVVVFDEDTPETVLRSLRPDVWVKGGDYSVASLPEARILREWGGRTVVVPYHEGRSTTRLLERMRR